MFHQTNIMNRLFNYKCVMEEHTNIPTELEHLIEQGKNKYNVYCIQCPSRILNSGVGFFKEIEFPLPDIKKNADCNEVTSEELKNYWMVNDMYAFENIGYSNTINGQKYLTCADCEIGPLGWFDETTKMSYLAISRVKYAE